MNNLSSLPSGTPLTVFECGVLEASSVMELGATGKLREEVIQ